MAYKLKSSVDSLCGSPVRAIDPMYNGKKGVQQADFEQFSSAAKMNAEKGTNPIYNLSGKKGLQPSNNPAAAYMTGSPAKLHELGHGTREPGTGFFGQKTGTGMFGEGSIFEPAFKRKKRRENASNIATTNNNFVPNTIGQGSETYNSETPNIGVISNDGGATPKVKTPEKRKPVEKFKSKISGVSKDLGTTGEKDKGTTIKTSKITSKKSPPPSAKITRAQIKDNKDTNKESGMSKRQIRLEKN